MLAGKMPAALRRAGIHDRRIGILDRLRLQVAALDAVEFAVVVERLVLRPQPLDDAEPLLGAGVAILVLQKRDAEHFHFGKIPAVDDVERVAAVGDVVDDGRLLGGDDRVVQRDMRGGHHARRSRRAGNAGRPGIGLKARTLRIGRAAKAAPARHRHQGLEIHLVGQLRQGHGIGPRNLEPAVEVRHDATGVEIGLKRAEFELTGPERRVGGVPVTLVGLGGGVLGQRL